MYKCYYSALLEYQEYFLGSKVDRCVGLTALPPQTPGNLRACPDLYRDCSTFAILRMFVRAYAYLVISDVIAAPVSRTVARAA